MCLLLGPAGGVFAQEGSAWSGEALVASQDEAERARALKPALTQALIKASGDSSLASDGRLTGVLERADSMVKGYTYREAIDRGPNGVAVTRLVLVAEFDPGAIQRALNELDRPFWEPNRPATLVWLVIDDGTKKTIASATQVAALEALTSHARERGVPLKFPLVDIDDRVDAETLWSGSPQAALTAAQRYKTPAALIARLAKGASGWTGRFTLVDALGAENWSVQYADSSSVLVAAAAGLADRMAQRYAVSASERVVADYWIWIANIKDPSDYGKVLKYLDTVSVMSAVTAEGSDGDRLLVKATLAVAPDRLRQVFALSNVLAFDDGASVEAGQLALRLVQ